MVINYVYRSYHQINLLWNVKLCKLCNLSFLSLGHWLRFTLQRTWIHDTDHTWDLVPANIFSISKTKTRKMYGPPGWGRDVCFDLLHCTDTLINDSLRYRLGPREISALWNWRAECTFQINFPSSFIKLSYSMSSNRGIEAGQSSFLMRLACSFPSYLTFLLFNTPNRVYFYLTETTRKARLSLVLTN